MHGRILVGSTQETPTFQVHSDAIALTPGFLNFYHADVPEICPRVRNASTNRNFASLINRGLSGKTSGLDKLRLSRAQILWDKTLSWRNKIGMHTSKDDYLINSLRFVSAKESTKIYGAILPECLTSPVIKESKAYKTYLGYATGAVPTKMAQKFKKASPSKKDSDLVLVDEEPIQKGKRVKRPTKKSTTKPAACVVIKEDHVESKSISKEKEKVDITRGKGIELLSEVALTEEAQMKEVRKKSLRDFYKTHIVVLDSTESESESWGNDEDDNNNKQESNNEGNEQENKSDEQESDSEQEEESEDDDQEDEEFVHTPTNDKDDDNLESESDDVIKSDEEKGMDDTTYQFDDDVDARLKEPTQTDKEVVQGEGADAEMNDAQQGNENLETTQEQVVEDAHVTISTVMKKTEVPVTSSSCSSDLASKFLNFSDIPHADAEIVSKLDVHVYPMKSQDAVTHRSYNTEVAELKKDPLHTQVTSLVDDHLDTRLGETREEFMNFLLESFTTRIKEKVKDQPPQILPKEVSNFALPVIKKLIKESRDEVTLAKVSSQPHSTYETASTLAEFELKMILIGHNEKTWPEKIWIKMKSLAGSGRGLKKRKTSKCRTTTEPTDPDWHEGKTPQKGPTQKWLTTLAASTSTDKSTLSKKIDWENPEGGDYPFDLSKPLPLIMRGKRQRVPVEYFINNDLKYLQGGVLTMTYTTSTTKTKAAQYDLPSIEDMSFYAYARGMQSRGDVYSTKRILAVTHVKVMRKHGYGYLEEIVVRRADNVLYRFKEVEDLQLGVESYQKQINVTKPDTTRPDLRKRHPYTPYKDPQGFIYVDDFKRNRLMRSDKLYKFSDGTLTRLLSSLEDITKNIDMEYLPKRRWSTLEKKRAHFMIKDINKLLKERRMMRSLEKFVGGRLYGTNLRLLQRTI
ncbi:hypothetical protein Tco_1576738 [Tanacetum coccineum]